MYGTMANDFRNLIPKIRITWKAAVANRTHATMIRYVGRSRKCAKLKISSLCYHLCSNDFTSLTDTFQNKEPFLILENFVRIHEQHNQKNHISQSNRSCCSDPANQSAKHLQWHTTAKILKNDHGDRAGINL